MEIPRYRIFVKTKKVETVGDKIENGLGHGHFIRCFVSKNPPSRIRFFQKQGLWIWEIPSHSMTDNIHRGLFFRHPLLLTRSSIDLSLDS